MGDQSETTMWLDLMGTGTAERFVTVNGVRTRVLDTGSGPAVVLLHGTGGHVETYQRNIGPLAQRYRVIVPDMIGHGYTDRPDIHYTLDDFAEHVFGLLDALGVERAHLSGESLGGCVAAWMALQRPERAITLVLNTGILERPDAAGLTQIEDVEARTRSFATEVSYATVRRRLEWLVVDPATMTEEMVQIRLKLYSQPGMPETLVRVMSAVLAMNRGVYRGKDYLSSDLLAKVSCPTQVIWSDHNPGKPYEKMRPAFDKLPDVEVHLVKNAGHWPQFEQADDVNRLMLDFLSRHAE